jgi:hypothetical protein
MSAV